MAFPMSRRGCFVCGKPGHIAAACTSTERLCFNCGEAGHESNACPNPKVTDNKQCYSCGGMGHLAAECPSVRVGAFSTNGPKCYNCQQFGHIARSCPNAAAAVAPTTGADGETIVPASVNGGGAAPVAAVPAVARAPFVPRFGGYAPRGGFAGGRGGYFGARQVRCYACGGVNHLAKNCLVGGGVAPVARGPKTCYKCQQEGHIARDCPQADAPVEASA
ncbi:hypothetical protein JCM3766R1_002349 [Sporobolomyces carnicolor]